MPFHICPEEILALMMVVPFIGGLFHRLRHWWRRTRCQEDESCVPKCEHPVVQEDYVYDPLDP